jgi:hypothetical protein
MKGNVASIYQATLEFTKKLSALTEVCLCHGSVSAIRLSHPFRIFDYATMHY